MYSAAEDQPARASIQLQPGLVHTQISASHSKIALIYTGGTLGMVASDKGLVPGGQMAERLLTALQSLPEARIKALPDFDLISLPRLIDSSNATPADWLYLSQLIADNADTYQGFIVLHGTDTLAYTASALSFLAPENNVVLITGSQYPLEHDQTDAVANVEGALLVVQKLLQGAEITSNTRTEALSRPLHPYQGLLFFGGKLLQGNRATKVSTYSHQGFDSINLTALGHCEQGVLTLQPECVNTERVKPEHAVQLQASLATLRDGQHKVAPEAAPVVILKLWPGIQASQITSLLAPPVAGVILESYGSGNAPDLNQPLLAALKAATDRGVIIVNRSQCPQGSVNMNYAAGSALADAGVISAFDMTCEAAFSKLSLLLMTRQTDQQAFQKTSQQTPEQLRCQFQRNFNGELSV